LFTHQFRLVARQNIARESMSYTIAYLMASRRQRERELGMGIPFSGTPAVNCH
jgi:hypothetical protein